MSDAQFTQLGLRRDRLGDRPNSTTSTAGHCTDDIKRHFQKNYPVMLDGALPKSNDQRNLLRQARESIAKDKSGFDMLPTAILRERLNSVAAAEQSVAASTKAGLTPVGPKTGRVWWDDSVLDNLDDILSRLDNPRAILRFYDVTGLNPDSGRWHEFFDIDVVISERGKTVNFWAGERSYIVDLGYVYAGDRFLELARTNLVTLPGDCAGLADDGETVRSLLRPRPRQNSPEVVPDDDARAWAMSRLDHEARDWDTELVVHMVYRSFLREGPRALRRSPKLFRRDMDVLRREFALRSQEKERRQVNEIAAQAAARPAVVIARLDVPRRTKTTCVLSAACLPATVPATREALSAATIHNAGQNVGENYVWYQDLVASSQRVARTGVLPHVEDAVVRVETENEVEDDDLVSTVIGDVHRPRHYTSQSVFEAARSLRRSLAGLPALDADLEDDVDLSDALVARSPESPEKVGAREEALRMFGGAEAKRMAKAGVRITRMALTLEGRMRPGARLKVAGKLVHADADGCFRLECVLTGRRASIPMRAGASIGGEARSLINVEWEKRASREKKKAW